MWTAVSHGWVTRIEKKTKRRLNGPANEEGSAVEQFAPKAGSTGSLRITDLRKVLSAIRYLARSGREWCILSVHFRLNK
jgi:putative transposase